MNLMEANKTRICRQYHNGKIATEKAPGFNFFFKEIGDKLKTSRIYLTESEAHHGH